MKHLVKKLLLRAGYQLSNLQIRHRDIFADPYFARVYACAQESTATPVGGVYARHTNTRYLAKNTVPGALVDGATRECGGTIAMIERLRTIFTPRPLVHRVAQYIRYQVTPEPDRAHL